MSCKCCSECYFGTVVFATDVLRTAVAIINGRNALQSQSRRLTVEMSCNCCRCRCRCRITNHQSPFHPTIEWPCHCDPKRFVLYGARSYRGPRIPSIANQRTGSVAATIPMSNTQHTPRSNLLSLTNDPAVAVFTAGTTKYCTYCTSFCVKCGATHHGPIVLEIALSLSGVVHRPRQCRHRFHADSDCSRLATRDGANVQ